MIKIKHPWYKHRGYSHFDDFMPIIEAEKLCGNKAEVARNSFFPFIKFDKEVPRYDRRKRKVIPKLRQIAYACHRDSHIYSYYSYLLSKAYEKRLVAKPFSECVLAYRKLGKSNIDFANEAFFEISKRAPCVVLGFDIEKYFDRIDHKRLKEGWSECLGLKRLPVDHYAVYRSLAKFSTVDRDLLYGQLGIGRRVARVRRRICSAKEFRDIVRGGGLIGVNREEYGIPQGSPISAMLSNIYLFRFDSAMYKLVSSIGGLYRRYCDDILVVCPSVNELTIRNEITRMIEAEKLKINTPKALRSEFTSVGGKLVASRPFQYLGFEFDGQRILIRPVTLARFWRRMKAACRLAKKSAASKNGFAGPGKVFKRKLYERFTHMGRRNFVSYAFKASRKMNSKEMKRQLRRHWAVLERELEKPL